MKTILILSFLIGGSAMADEMPAASQLAKFGYSNCVAKTVFANNQQCGETIAQIFDCGKRGTVLAVGTIGSDVAGQCSPTIVFKEVLESR